MTPDLPSGAPEWMPPPAATCASRTLGNRLMGAWRRSRTYARFCVVGGSGVLVDMSVLFLLSPDPTNAFRLACAKLMAAEAAMLSNFSLNEAWTFRRAKTSPDPGGSALGRLARFHCICLAGIAVNLLLLTCLVSLGRLDLYLSNAVCIVAVSLWNYHLNARFNWGITHGPDG